MGCRHRSFAVQQRQASTSSLVMAQHEQLQALCKRGIAGSGKGGWGKRKRRGRREAGGGQLENGGSLFNKCFYSASVLNPLRCVQRA